MSLKSFSKIKLRYERTVFPSDFQVDLPDPRPGDKRVGEKVSEAGTTREDEGGLAGERGGGRGRRTDPRKRERSG